MELQIRKATAADVAAIHGLVRELATFERAPEAHTATPEDYLRDGFRAERPWFEAFLAEPTTEGAAPVGVAFCTWQYSTWRGRTYYLEDFYVQPQFRSRGIGQRLFERVVQRAGELGARRLAWQVLHWNTEAQRFYTERFGAAIETGWYNGRLEGEALQKAIHQLTNPPAPGR